MRLTRSEGKQARRALAESGHSMAATARLAKTSYRMATYWYHGVKGSLKLHAAHKTLTGQDLSAAREERRLVKAS